MTHITFDAPNHGWNLGFVTERIAALRMVFGQRSRRRQAFRRIEAELDQYSAEEIAELGISHADIEFIADEAAGPG